MEAGRFGGAPQSLSRWARKLEGMRLFARSRQHIAPWLVPLLVLLLLLLAPLVVPPFRVNLLGKYVTYAIAALAIDLIWGYTGLLSLGQGVFFGLGAYAMA